MNNTDQQKFRDLRIDLNEYENGLYFIHLNTDDESKTRRMILSR